MTDILSAPPPLQAKILLVENNLAGRDMLIRRLERRGFAACGAADGPSGVALTVSEMPDVILMDIFLGGMDGWEATRLIKDDPRTKSIPIIFLTASPLSTHREKSIEAGCADYDFKPVDLERLLGKIQACLLRKNPPASVSLSLAS